MTVTVNLTSIPPRFAKLQALVDNIRSHSIVDDIYIHVPKVYTVKEFAQRPLSIVGAHVNYVDEDHGPCRRYVYAKGDDVIVIIDDDTWYHPDITTDLVRRHRETGHIWGGSGFNFSKYFLGDFSKINGEQVQVVEGFGMIVLNRTILDAVVPDVCKYSQYFPTSDDILMNTLYDKYGFKRFYHCEPHWVKQLDYGFGPDALHNQNDGTHMNKYKQSLKKLRELGEMHFSPFVTYGVTVCNEATELRTLLEVLVDSIIHSDEIVVQADSSKVTREVLDVIEQFKPYIRFTRAPFENNFAQFKNTLGDAARGKFIFQIDADEVPTGTLIEKVYILTHADLVYIPRVNIMLGMTDAAMKLHSFHLNEAGFINYPDMQGRFYKKGLQWVGSVHEKVSGADKISQVPPDPKLSLWHVKTVRKSRAQKEFYESSKFCVPTGAVIR